MKKVLCKIRKRVATKKEFDKRYEGLMDKREDATHNLMRVQFEIEDLFDKDYDRLFNNKRR